MENQSKTKNKRDRFLRGLTFHSLNHHRRRDHDRTNFHSDSDSEEHKSATASIGVEVRDGEEGGGIRRGRSSSSLTSVLKKEKVARKSKTLAGIKASAETRKEETGDMLDRIIVCNNKKELYEYRDTRVIGAGGRIKTAYRHYQAATHGRSVDFDIGTMSEWRDWAWRIQYSKVFQKIFLFAIFLHCSLVFFEPSSFRDARNHSYGKLMGLLGVEIIFCLIYGLKSLVIVLLVREKIFRRSHDLAIVILSIICFIDVFFTLCISPHRMTLRVSRILRPIFFFFVVRKLLDFVKTFFRILPFIIDVFLLVIFLLVIFGIMGVQLFDDILDYRDASDGDFNNVPRAILTLFVLLTTENYPSIMEPAYNSSSGYAFYFIVFCLFGIFVLMATLSAVTFNTFMEEYRKQVIINRVFERRELMKSFLLLDIDNSGQIDFTEFYAFVNYIRPKASMKEVVFMFRSLDRDADGSVDMIEFFQVPELTELSFVNKNLKGARNTRWGRWCFKLVTDPSFNLFIIVAILLNTISLCFTTVDMSDTRKFAIELVDYIFLGLFVVEMVLKIMAVGFKSYIKLGWNRFDFSIIFVSCLFPLLEYAMVIFENFQGTSFRLLRLTRIFKVFRLTRVLKTFRLMAVEKRFQVLIATFIRMSPVFLNMGSILLIVFYCYGILGMEFFSGGWTVSSSLADYKNFSSTFLVLFQLLTGSNWHELMYEAISNTTVWASLYYVSFFLIVIVILLNILIALMLETFTVQKAKSADQERLLYEVLDEQDEIEDTRNEKENPLKNNIVEKNSSSSSSSESKETSKESADYQIWKIRSRKGRDWARDLFFHDIGTMTKHELTRLSADLMGNIVNITSRTASSSSPSPCVSTSPSPSPTTSPSPSPIPAPAVKTSLSNSCPDLDNRSTDKRTKNSYHTVDIWKLFREKEEARKNNLKSGSIRATPRSRAVTMGNSSLHDLVQNILVGREVEEDNGEWKKLDNEDLEMHFQETEKDAIEMTSLEVESSSVSSGPRPSSSSFSSSSSSPSPGPSSSGDFPSKFL